MDDLKVLKISASEVERHFSGYAYPLVKTFYRAANTSIENLGILETRLKETFEVTLKYLSIALISLYYSHDLNNDKINKAILGLGHPSLGMYSSVLRDILKAFKNIDPPLVSRIRDFYDGKMDNETFENIKILSNIVNYPTPNNARSFKQMFDVLVIYRNRASSHGATVSDDEQRVRIKALSHVIYSLMEQIRFIGELPLIEMESTQTTQDGTSQKVKIWNGLASKNDVLQTGSTLIPGHLYIDASGIESGKTFLDLFPLCAALNKDSGGTGQIYFLNGTKKSKVEYLSYQDGTSPSVTSSHRLFDEIQDNIKNLSVAGGGRGLPDHLKRHLEISDISIGHFQKAEVAMADGDSDTAIDFLEHAIRESPGHREAVRLLVELNIEEGHIGVAHEKLSEYLDFVPNDLDFLLTDTKLLITLGKRQEAVERIQHALSEDPNNTESIALQAKVEKIAEDSTEEVAEVESFDIYLLYECIAEIIFGSPKKTKKYLFAFIGMATVLEFLIFFLNKDLIMGLTVCSMGMLWATTIWATFHIQRLLFESRPNFAAFLKSRKNKNASITFHKLIEPVFGHFPINENSDHDILNVIKNNYPRLSIIVFGAFSGTAWLFLITKYSPTEAYVDISYSIYCFMLFFCLSYIFTCLFMFHRLLRLLRFQKIHFSLVQHPKLSIRYLSHLSRKISYPLLAIYIAATFTLYIGPFLANVAFIGALSAAMILICYIYYSTILLVRRVIIQNKWSLIARFSAHFDKPFDRLILRAETADMDRLKELIEMRDFLDAINVWAERKSVLIVNSIFYVLIIAFSTIGMSNLMTRKVLPPIARYASSKMVSEKSEPFVVGNTIVGDTIGGDTGKIEIRVRDVDDTFIVGCNTTLDGLLENSRENINRYSDLSESYPDSFVRCDWSNGMHGRMDIEAPLDHEKHLLLIAYNKVYHGFLWMGGGKLSYDVEVEYGGSPVFNNKRFVRFNTREIAYVAYIHLTTKNSEVVANVFEGDNAMENPQIRESVMNIKHKLDAEDDAKADVISSALIE